ncbi:hypothetical protein L873DRAFT_1796971 [Choiromyces venosus 120613-1]|uniref:Uncharacterized protein n=1 Tax=Choiromyces venosus 120613-1 TaxID=1336337 RepID=A0A3N4K9T4_9PEZI|nr:hypothetical protein L873DRAFT_1796971 [Choiromyces venosus 120613-1]
MHPRKRRQFLEEKEDNNSRDSGRSSKPEPHDGSTTRLSESKNEESISLGHPSASGPPAKRLAMITTAKPTTRLPPAEAAAALDALRSAPNLTQAIREGFRDAVLIHALKLRIRNADRMIERWSFDRSSHPERHEAIDKKISDLVSWADSAKEVCALEDQIYNLMAWVLFRLRDGYWAFVQKIPPDFSPVSSVGNSKSSPKGKGKSAKSDFHGWACDSPVCRKSFKDGQYRISFEPPVHSGTFSNSDVIDLNHDNNNQGEEEKSSIPNNEQDCAFFCLSCFEELLMPEPKNKVEAKSTNPLSWEYIGHGYFHLPDGEPIRPSLSCRIYDRFKAETRSDSHEAFLLGPNEESVVQMWKNYNYNQGLSKLSIGGSSLSSKGPANLRRNCTVEGVDGRGLAQAMAAHRLNNPVSSHS